MHGVGGCSAGQRKLPVQRLCQQGIQNPVDAEVQQRGEKACNGGENFFDKIKDEADNARKQRSFVHRLDAVAAPQPLYRSKIVVSPFKRPPDLFEYGKEHAVSPGIINIV